MGHMAATAHNISGPNCGTDTRTECCLCDGGRAVRGWSHEGIDNVV